MLFDRTKPIYRKLELSDREWVQQLIREDKNIGCEYSFASMYLWQDIYETTYARLHNCLIRKSEEDYTHVTYHYPIGLAANRVKALKYLVKEADRKHKKLLLYGLSDDTMAEMRSLYGEKDFQYEMVRDNQNYILSTDKIANLKETIYRDKRRFTNRFKENNNWSYEELTKDKAILCERMSDEWYREQEESLTKAQELEVTKKAVRLFDELKLSGGMLKVDGKVVAFTMGEQLQENMYVLHFMKAYRGVYGAYQMVINMLAKALMTDYLYINMEEDMGEEGIRRSKTSWAPEYLSNYYNVTIPAKRGPGSV